jgi:hypothetical protein
MAPQRVEPHLDDVVRLGVLGALEEAKLRLTPHLMACEQCQMRLLDLADELDALTDTESVSEVTCEQVRHAVLQLLDLGKALTREHLAHLHRCEDCYDLFVEPAKALRVIGEGEMGEMG